jgi:hypothetical protein
MSSPNSKTNNMFRSQRIQYSGGSPLLLAPNPINKSLVTSYKPAPAPLANNGCYQQEDASAKENVTWQWKIEASMIPSLNIYYMLEPTSITLKQIPLPVVELRMSNYLRIQSIAYTFDASSVRFDCVTSNMLKFVIQLWRVGGGSNLEDPNKALTVELQRRQGSVVEMQSIRKMMFRALLTGEQPPAVPDDRPRQPPLPDTIMVEVDAGYDHDAGRADAFEICLRLLESPCLDQSRLGLESLKMLTEPSIVSHQDAMIASRAIVFQEGCFGERLQTALAGYFGAQDSNINMKEYEDMVGHGMALAIVASALQLVLDDKTAGNEQPTAALNTTSGFWALVTQDLFHNVERAMTMPHEGAKSAKCIRLLHDLHTTQVPTIRQAGLRSCLTKAHQYGQRYHLSLEKESQKLLAMDTDSCLRAH